MSAATPCTENCTSSRSPSRSGTDHPPGSRFAWTITGSGHGLEECMALAERLPRVDLFLSAAAEEVLPLYGLTIGKLKQRFRVFRDKSASSVPVGLLYG